VRVTCATEILLGNLSLHTLLPVVSFTFGLYPQYQFIVLSAWIKRIVSLSCVHSSVSCKLMCYSPYISNKRDVRGLVWAVLWLSQPPPKRYAGV
jgi:hypothetical protein